MENKKLPVEKWKHKNVFETYLLMGPSRSLKGLSEATGIYHNTLKIWARQWKWNDRCWSRDQKALAAIEKENDIVLKETVMRRHQQAYQKVSEKALEYLESEDCTFGKSKTPARDAAVALDIGIKGERGVLGLRDTKLKGAVAREGFAAMLELVMPEG